MIPFVLASLSFVSQAALVQPQSVGVVGPTYRFGDYDGDGLADVYAVRSSARDRLYRNLGDGTFVDVTDSVGLSDVSGTRLALWQDFDGDGALDLYVCAANGRSRLFKNEAHTSFVDVTLAAGVGHRGDGDELFGEWIDFDLDGWIDLHVVTSKGDRLWRNLRDGRFERAQLPAADELDGAVIALSLPQPSAQSTQASSSAAGEIDGAGTGGPLALGNRCPQQVKDAATGNCTWMSTTPTLGMLYPLSTNLNVDVSGNVGMGTATPGQKLDVSGNVRASGQLMSSVTTGTAPLAVSSATKVTNFNADTLDGIDSSAFSQLGPTIEGSEITDGTVDAVDIAGSAVTTGKLASNSVTSGKISDGTIATVDIAPGAITNSLLASGAVGAGNIALSAVGSAQIANGAVGSVQLAAGAVSTTQLAADAVDSSRVLNGSIALADLASNSVDGSKIVDGSVDVADLAGSSVTSGKIANGTIATVDIANNAITSALLATNSVTNAHLQLGAVGLPNLNTTGATTGQVLGFNGSNAQWITAPSTNWTPIGSLPYTISTPGAYYLTGNLTGVASFDGITVDADNVVIDLNGFRLTGATGSLFGIVQSANKTGVIVRNGSVVAFGSGGVRCGLQALVQNIIARNSPGNGIEVSGGTIDQCTAKDNSGYGIVIGYGMARDSTATGNGVGIAASVSTVDGCNATFSSGDGVSSNTSTIVNSVAINNTSNGISATYSRIANCVTTGNGSSGVEVSSTLVSNCYSYGNVAYGINLNATGSVLDCLAESNLGAGIRADTNAYVARNTSRGQSSSQGILISGSDCRVDENNVIDNQVGILVNGTHNLLIRNSARNATNYTIAAGNSNAQVLTPGAAFVSTDPWANFSY